MKKFLILFVTSLLLTLTPKASAVDVLEQLGIRPAATTNQSTSTLSIPLSQDQMVQALKEALGKGLQQAVSTLGQTNGFLTNANVRIPMPEKLKPAEKALRSMKQDKLADDLILTMNRAAEQAVPAAISVFSDALKQMSITDAKNVLTGTTNAATQFFRRTTETNLYAKFLPIVKSATQTNRVVEAYKNLITKAQSGTLSTVGATNTGTLGGVFGGILNKTAEYYGNNAVDVDAYVTQKALDGLFKMVSEEERKIRENPSARGTELLQKVFGAIKK